MPPCLRLRVGAFKTQLSNVSEISGPSSSIIIKIPIQTGHRQCRQNRIHAPDDFGVRSINRSSITFPCERLG